MAEARSSDVRCSAMHKSLSTWVLLGGLLSAGAAEASANFAHRNIGVGVSGFAAVGEPPASGLTWGLPFSFEVGLYLESGFEFFIQPQGMILQMIRGADTPDGKGSIFGTGGHVGVRYLFMEESVRPYVALHIAVLGLFTVPSPLLFVGPGASLGCDFFVNESISLGVRATFDTFLALNTNPSFVLGGGVYATTYF